jgi:hypothetical protein
MGLELLPPAPPVQRVGDVDVAKYKDGNFLQFPRGAFKNLSKLKTSAKWLYVVLTELEHRFTGKNEDFFFRSLKDLSEDSGLSVDCVCRSLKSLQEHGLIDKWQMHWRDKGTGKLSEKHITAIRIRDQ